MQIRWMRVVVGAVFVTLIPFALLAFVTIVFRPADTAGAAAFAATAGRWAGPIGGTLVATLVALLIARSLADRRLLHGVLIGLVAVVFDVGILTLAAPSFDWLFVAGNVGRLAGGAVGGKIASRAS